MVSLRSRRGEAGASSLYLMIGAFVSTALLMTWLFFQAAPVEVAVVEGALVEEGDRATFVDLEDFAADPMAYAGIVIQLNGLTVESRIGSEAFFVVLPNSTAPYFVKMLPEGAGSGVEIQRNGGVSAVGTVYAMSDSASESWVASGGIAEGDRILADFALSFFEASGVTVTAEPPPEEN